MDKETVKAYNLYPEGYAVETTEFWKNFPKRMIMNFAGWVGDKIALSIGSGPGTDAEILREFGVDLVCLDASFNMVRTTDHKSLTSIQANLIRLPFIDQSVFGVWAYTSLVHIPREYFRDALTEIYRVLQSNGILALGMIDGGAEQQVITEGVPVPRGFSYHSTDEIVSTLKATNFHPFYYEQYKPGSKNKYLHFLAKRLN